MINKDLIIVLLKMRYSWVTMLAMILLKILIKFDKNPVS